jgi:oxygen-independent coproporphyrinogen-3 oxidase
LPDQSVPLSIGGQARRAAHAGVALAGALTGEGFGGAAPPARSLYIHTPFCTHKCHYCDFFSFVQRGGVEADQQGVFVERLLRELEALAVHARGAPLRTIFVGGGTPSLLRVELWERLLQGLEGLFDLSMIRAERRRESGGEAPQAEFTVECNPETTSDELMACLHAGGVTRVSMGAQSFVARHLATLQRLHDPESVGRAVEVCRRAGVVRVSMDLIYAIPGQTLAEWEGDVRRALAFGTTHLSCYNLTYEPHTQMTVRMQRGEFAPVEEELEADMFELAGALARERGLARYEVSNYAVPGQACLHNLAYWRGEQWLAAGPSASGHRWAGGSARAGGHRTKNVGSMAAYLGSAGETGGFAPLSDHEAPDPVRALRERLMTGVRLAEGVAWDELCADVQAVAPRRLAALESVVAELRGDGLVERSGDFVRVTERGWLLADWVAKRLMGALGAGAE